MNYRCTRDKIDDYIFHTGSLCEQHNIYISIRIIHIHIRSFMELDSEYSEV